jgi:UDP-N-acetylmuramoyl-tripeptide--D-alanyl-D-alanine ligase
MNRSGQLTAREAAQRMVGEVVAGDPEQLLAGFSIDTRTLQAGELFIALRGERFDAHVFFPQALGRGAAALVGRKGSLTPPPQGWRYPIALIEVADTLYSLGELARQHRRHHPVPLLAITGSNGKTTTKEMIAGILAANSTVLKNEGNLNNLIGLPLTLLRLRPEHRMAVVEMGVNQPGEIRRLCEIARPQYGLITQVAPVHLEGLGSIEGVAHAKGELFEALNEDHTAVVNIDDPLVVQLADRTSAARVTFGFSGKPMVGAVQLSPFERSGAAMTLVIQAGSYPLRLCCPGFPYIQNALGAAAAAWAMGCSVEQITAGLESFKPFPMRLTLMALAGGYQLIDDSYNANPTSATAALETLCRLADGRMVAVLGDMLELGRESAEAHRRLGRHAAKLGVQVLIGVGSWAGDLARGALEWQIPPRQIHTVATAEAAAETLLDRVRSGDWILVKGSRGVGLEKVVEVLLARRPAK